MEKKDKYDDLHSKTIFDFCDDMEVIKKLNIYLIIEYFGKDKYIELRKNEPLNNAIDLDELSWALHDPMLRTQVNLQFAKELAAHFNE